MDESATGSVRFCLDPSAAARSDASPPAASVRSRRMHLRPPSIDHGVISFVWAFGLGLYLWLGMLAIGVSGATAFVLAAVAACAIFLFVRIYGEDDPRRPW